MLRLIFLPIVVSIVLTQSLTLAEAPVIVTLTLGSEQVAQRDCQVLQISALNTSKKLIVLDELFPLILHGPHITVETPEKRSFRVVAMQQGIGCTTAEHKTEIKPGQSQSLFAVVMAYKHDDQDDFLFDRPGIYKFQAGVRIAGEMIVSDAQKCEVLKDSRVEWKGRQQELLRLMEDWRWPIHGKQALENLPPGSMMSVLAELSTASKGLLRGDEGARATWEKVRTAKGDAIGDYAAEAMAHTFIGKKRYRDAVQEVGGMKIKSERAIALEAEAKRLLNAPIVIGPVQ